MSLWIDIDKVVAVFIGGEWFDVDWRESSSKPKGRVSTFELDSYEYIERRFQKYSGEVTEMEPRVRFHEDHGSVSATGFEFKSMGRTIKGPMDSIQAIEELP